MHVAPAFLNFRASTLQNLAVALQNRMSEVLHVDIHPGAKIGRGMLIDHATGVVRASIHKLSPVHNLLSGDVNRQTQSDINSEQ